MIKEFKQDLANTLKHKFNQDLLSIVLFGSFIKGTFTGTSDIDVLVVNPLMLEIYETNEIVYDRDNFFKQLLMALEKNLHRWHAEKLEKGVWEIPGLAVIESG